jgi:hypothetical protein
MRIEKKVWSEYFQAILDGEKSFELRLNDFECKPGDILVLREWVPSMKQYTGRVLEREVGYILKFKPQELPFWPKEEIEKHGFQIISLKPKTW